MGRCATDGKIKTRKKMIDFESWFSFVRPTTDSSKSRPHSWQTITAVHCKVSTNKYSTQVLSQVCTGEEYRPVDGENRVWGELGSNFYFYCKDQAWGAYVSLYFTRTRTLQAQYINLKKCFCVWNLTINTCLSCLVIPISPRILQRAFYELWV